MLVDRKFQIWLSADGGSTGRRSLEHVDILNQEQAELAGLHVSDDYNGLMLATNGFILSVIPIELDEDDIPGLLLPSILKEAIKASPKVATGGNVFVDLRVEGMARLFNNATYPRVNQDGLIFPSVAEIIPKTRPAKLPDYNTICINTKLLVACAKSIGVGFLKNDTGQTCITFNGDQFNPYMVEPAGINGDNFYTAPFALIMPMQYKGQ